MEFFAVQTTFSIAGVSAGRKGKKNRKGGKAERQDQATVPSPPDQTHDGAENNTVSEPASKASSGVGQDPTPESALDGMRMELLAAQSMNSMAGGTSKTRKKKRKGRKAGRQDQAPIPPHARTEAW